MDADSPEMTIIVWKIRPGIPGTRDCKVVSDTTACYNRQADVLIYGHIQLDLAISKINSQLLQ